MKSIFKSDSLSIGLALFAMFFGAGNIIYPLALGQFAGDKNHIATFGFLLTATLMPLAGVIAMILFDGSYKDFFGRLGRLPGFLLALLTISLLGPLGSTPRCIALSFTTLKSSSLDISPIIFSAAACLIIFLFTIRKNHILTLLGWVLTPILLLSLGTIIIMGLVSSPATQEVDSSHISLLWHGLKEGYNTMDLLAAFFFSSSIIAILRQRQLSRPEGSGNPISIAFYASLVAAFLLGAVYIGFSYLASFHGSSLGTTSPDELLGAITTRIAGSHAGLLINVAVVFACLTTAIALICAFTDFVQKELLNEIISYEMTLVGALLITFFVSTYEFTGISTFLGPILKICYPGLIMLTFLNIAHKITGFQYIQGPVLLTFIVSAFVYFLP